MRDLAERCGITYRKSITLKVVCNENQGGSGRWHTFGIGLRLWRSRFVCLLTLLSSLTLRISVSAPVKQNEKALSYLIGETLQ
jgi:hypothetical protein